MIFLSEILSEFKFIHGGAYSEFLILILFLITLEQLWNNYTTNETNTVLITGIEN